MTVREINAPHGTAERVRATERAGGRSSVPQIFIDGRHVGGCDDLVALDRRGALDRLRAITPEGLVARVLLTMTDEPPYAFAQVTIEAHPDADPGAR